MKNERGKLPASLTLIMIASLWTLQRRTAKTITQLQNSPTKRPTEWNASNQFDLVCERQWLRSLVSSAALLGKCFELSFEEKVN